MHPTLSPNLTATPGVKRRRLNVAASIAIITSIIGASAGAANATTYRYPKNLPLMRAPVPACAFYPARPNNCDQTYCEAWQQVGNTKCCTKWRCSIVR